MHAEESTRGPVSVALVQHRILDCLGLASLFRDSPKLQLMGASISLSQFVGMCRKHQPKVAIIDVRFPAGTAFEAATDMLENNYVNSVLFLDDEVCLARANQALGISRAGYFAKSASFEEIQEAIEKLSVSELAFDPLLQQSALVQAKGDGTQRRFDSPLLAKLTPRERQVMKLLAEGRSVREIASVLQLADSTVDNHASRLRKKLGIRKVADLTRLAMRHGLVD